MAPHSYKTTNVEKFGITMLISAVSSVVTSFRKL